MFSQKIFLITHLVCLNCCISYAQEMGWIKAQAIRDNIVSVKSDYGVGFGLIVGEKDNVLYIATANHVVRGMQDGGPKDKSNVSLGFFTEQGSTYSGVLEETWLSSKREDLAVITITTPPRFKWRHEGFSPLRTNVEATSVWYVGRDGRWDVSDNAGKIVSGTSKGKLLVEGFNIVPGMSGGVIISEYGVEGLVQRNYKTGMEIISLESIKNFMKAWGHPWGIEGIEKRFTDHEKKSAFGKQLIVKDNDTLIINRAYVNMIVEIFSMGKNSVIIFEEDVSKWSVVALKASFGKGALIDGRGWDGYTGRYGRPGYVSMTCSVNGGNGTDGGTGGNGKNGVDISLKMGIVKLDGLSVNLSGGQGGEGGRGGDGGSGGSNVGAVDCKPGDGGNGGNGGTGGNGADGGILRLDYFFHDDPEKKLTNLNFIGNPGSRGYGGSAGHSGSRGVNHRSGVPDARHGEFGSTGYPGEDGRKGSLILIKM